MMNAVKNILLVDDDIDDQEFFIEALELLDNVNLYGVANNGKEALGILGNSVSLPDLIFLDVNMPVMNGLECLTEIVKNPRTNTIPVIILSSAFEQAELSRKLGAKGFIKKSSDLKGLRTELHRIITLNITVNYLGASPGFISSPEKTNYEKA